MAAAVGSKSSAKTWGRSGWQAGASAFGGGRSCLTEALRGWMAPPLWAQQPQLGQGQRRHSVLHQTRQLQDQRHASSLASLLANSAADDLTSNLVWVAIEPLRIGNELPHNTSPNFEALFRGTGNRQGIAEGHNTARNFRIFTKFEA